MTVEEAIRNLDAMWKMLTSAYDDIADSHVIAYTMAVDALKEQIDKDTNVPSNDDTISRQAAIDRAVTIPMFGRDVKMVAVSEIKNLPSAQPKPCEDAVSRQTLQKELALYPIDDITSEDEAGYNRAINDVQKMVLHLPSAQSNLGKYEYHYDHTDCIWYRPEARNRCPVTCAQYRDGWNDAMNYIFRDGKGYMPYRRDKQYGE